MPLTRMDVTGTRGDLSTGCSLNTLKSQNWGVGGVAYLQVKPIKV